MRGAWLGCGLLGCALLTSSAHAATEGQGLISVVAGWRYTPNDSFSNAASLEGTPLTHASPGGPMLVTSFGYVALPWLAVVIDGFVGGERLSLAGQPPLTSISYGAMIGPRFLPNLGNGWSLSLGLSTGAALVNVSGLNLAQADEQLCQGYMGTAGAWWEAWPHVSLGLEYRLLLARGSVPGYAGINGGGSWVGLGVSFEVAATQSTPSHLNIE